MQMSVAGFVGQYLESGPSWQLWDWGEACPWDQPLKDRFNGFFAAADTIVLSRKLLDGGYLTHWTQLSELYPHRPFFAFARRITEVRKIVFSKALTESPWPGTELAGGDLAAEIDGGNIVAFGGAGFAGALVAAGLVDELELYVNPVALGEGQRIFAETSRGTALRLLEVSAYDCGIAVSTYAPTPSPVD